MFKFGYMFKFEVVAGNIRSLARGISTYMFNSNLNMYIQIQTYIFKFEHVCDIFLARGIFRSRTSTYMFKFDLYICVCIYSLR